MRRDVNVAQWVMVTSSLRSQGGMECRELTRHARREGPCLLPVPLPSPLPRMLCHPLAPINTPPPLLYTTTQLPLSQHPIAPRSPAPRALRRAGLPQRRP